MSEENEKTIITEWNLNCGTRIRLLEINESGGSVAVYGSGDFIALGNAESGGFIPNASSFSAYFTWRALPALQKFLEDLTAIQKLVEK